MRVDLLGPLRVTSGGLEVPLRGTRLRVLCSRLALEAGRPVPAHLLVGALWPDEPPRDATGALQSLVSRLRAALGDPALVRQVQNGYQLQIGPEQVDALCFTRLGRDPATVREALAWWRGPVDRDLDLPHLDRLRIEALLDRIDLDLAAGVTGLVDELQTLAEQHPDDERIAGRLVTALADEGRQSEALAAYEVIRGRLAEELGADPSADLRARHLAALRHDGGQRPHNLRAALTRFVGREAELADLSGRIADHRLVTVVGAGGAGKTRLATEAVRRVPAPDGTWFVELAPVTDPDDVPRAALSAVGRRELALLDRRAAPREVVDQLVAALGGGRRMLLVLDNAEHLLGATAALADTLLARCPDLRVLTTSREPLGVAGESLVTLTPLGLPAEGSSPSEALRWPSVVLFADRAAAVSPTFVVDEASVSDVVEVVRRLDGLPLALELAAARLRTLALADVRRRLDDRFRLLTGGSRTALPRHRTLRAVVAWSWDLLTADEPALAERACVFPGGLTADSAAAVLPRDDVDELLAALTDKSLLQLVDGGRYRMLETLRKYGSELLAERGELLAVRRDHARWFTGLARTADPYLRTSQQLVWLKRLDDEHENLLSALRFLVEEGDSDAALELALDLGWFWVLHGRHAEAAASMDLVMTMPPGSDARLRLGARAVQALNAMAARQEDPFTGGTLEEELAAVADALADVGELHHPVLDVLVPSVMYLADRSEDGARLIERAITSEDTWLRGAAHMFRARFAENDGDLDQVRQDVGPATRAFRDVGDRWGLASVLPLVALLQQYDGDLDAAVTTLEEAEELAAAFGGDVDDRLFIALRLSDLHDRRGDRARSELAMASAREVKGRGSRELRAACDALLAITLLGTGDLDRARDALRDATEALGPPPEAERFAPHGAAVVSAATALLCAVDGDLDGARRRLTDAHRAAVLTRDGPIGAVVAVTGAQVAVLADRLHHAAHLLGAAAVLRGADDSTAVDIRSVQVAVTAGVGEEVFAGAYAAGRGLDRLQATAMLAPDYVCRL